MKKLLSAIAITTLITGCATTQTTNTLDHINVNTDVTEAKLILKNRAKSTETMCIDKTNLLNCEMLGVSANDPRNFIQFSFVKVDENTSKIYIKQWSEIGTKIDEIDVTKDTLNNIADYIEQHKNPYK